MVGLSPEDSFRVDQLWQCICKIGGLYTDTIIFMAEYLVGKVFERKDCDYLRRAISSLIEPKQTEVFLRLYMKNANSLEPLIQALQEDGFYDLVQCLTSDHVDGSTIARFPSPRKMLNLNAMWKVPRKPEFHVRRREVSNALRREFHGLMAVDNGIIVVHGMAGCGKSSLVADLLNDPAIVRNCVQTIFWNKVSSETEVLSEFTSCYGTALMDTSIDKCPVDAVFQYPGNAIDALVRIIASHYPKAVIVLDGLQSHSVRSLFERHKGRFIVTTRDQSLFTAAHTSHLKCIEVNPSGLTYEETVSLFMKALSHEGYACTEDKLPPQVATLHKLAEGHPLVISLIASLIRAHNNTQSIDRWTYYCDKLRDTDTTVVHSDSYQSGWRDKVPQSFGAAMQLSFDDLDNNEMKKFMKLVVFFRGCKITPTLCALLWSGFHENQQEWRDRVVDAEDTLSNFKRRSLLEPGCDTSFYLHTMVANFLRQKWKESRTEKDMQQLHASFVGQIETLLASPGGDSVKKSCQCHLYYYLTYHHVKGAMYKALCQYYSDLHKLKSILSIVSPSCLFADMVTYSDVFTLEKCDKLDDYHNFLRKNSDVLHVEGVDLVELGLAEPDTSHVFEQARRIATERVKNEQALFWLPLSGNENRFLAFYDGCHCDRKLNISCAQFVQCAPSLVFMMIKEANELLICHSKSGKTMDTLQFRDEIRMFVQVCRSEVHEPHHNDKLFVVHTESSDVTLYMYDAYTLRTGVDCLNYDETQETAANVCTLRRHISNYVPSSNSDLQRILYKPTVPCKMKYSYPGHTVLSCAVSSDEKCVVAATNDRHVVVWLIGADNAQPVLIREPEIGNGSSDLAWICINSVGYDAVDSMPINGNGCGDGASEQAYDVLACWRDGTLFRSTIIFRGMVYAKSHKSLWTTVGQQVVAFDASVFAAVACLQSTLMIWQFTGGANGDGLLENKVVDLISACQPTTVCMSPDGMLTAVGFVDSFVAVYCVVTSTLHYRLHCAGGCVNGLSFSTDSSRLLVASGTQLVMNWDLDRVRQEWRSTKYVNHICLLDSGDSDKRRIVTVDNQKKIKVRSMDLRRHCVSTVITSTVTAVAVSDNYIACSVLSGQVNLFDLNLQPKYATDSGFVSNIIICMQFRDIGLLIIDHQKTKIWTPPYRHTDCITVKETNGHKITCADLTCKSRIILGSDNGIVSIIDLDGANCECNEVVASAHSIIALSYNSDTNLIAVLSSDNNLQVFSLNANEIQLIVPSIATGKGSFLISLSESGYIAVGGPFSQLNIYKIESNEVNWKWKAEKCPCKLSKLIWKNDSVLLTLGGSLKAYDCKGKCIQRYPVPGNCVQWVVGGDNIVVLDAFGIVHSLCTIK